jgi:hypothetical protein
MSNMGCLLIAGLFLLSGFIMLLVLRAVKSENPKLKSFAKSLERIMFWNSLSEVMQISYFMLTLSTILNYKSGFDWSNGAATASNVFLILGAVMIFAWPIWMGKFLKSNYKKHGFKKIKQKMTFIHSRLRVTTSSFTPIMAPLIFMAKRFIFLLICFYCEKVAI